MQELVQVLDSVDETKQFAQAIGSHLRGGECFEFISDLGGGKTTFVRGLVAGTGSSDHVSSPTFTISKQYRSDKLHLYHYDFYRLAEPGLVAEELAESVDDEHGVILVEWAQTVQDVLPVDRIVIELSKVADEPDSRQCSVRYPDKYGYLFEGAA